MTTIAFRGCFLVACLSLGHATSEPSAAVTRVVNMLTNIVDMIETEGQTDDEKTEAFQAWCKEELTTNRHIIAGEQQKIEDYNAILMDLRAQKTKLDDVVGGLNQQITDETSQLNQATGRRNEEHASFVSEMQNFDNAISACDKASVMLTAHYGDGTPHEAKKPGWMSLLNKQFATVRTIAHAMQGKQYENHKLFSLVKRNPNMDTYQESTGEGLNIVDQVKDLRNSFAEDQSTSREEESRLQELYDNLAKQKTELIASLSKERDTEQTQLNEVNEGIAENESALKMSQEILQDRQGYVSRIEQQRQTQTNAYNARRSDRLAELQAVSQAVQSLQSRSFMQETATVTNAKEWAKHGKVAAHTANMAHLNARFDEAASRLEHRVHRGTRKSLLSERCATCGKVSALLKEKAKLYHSSVLAMAAATSVGNEALADVIRSLEGMENQLDRDQATEKEHKEWCEQETGLTSDRRDTHEYAVATIQQSIADLSELIRIKEVNLKENKQDINGEETSFGELQTIRGEQHEEFDEDIQDHQDAIAALNEAINILAEFYAKRNKDSAALLQGSQPKSGSAAVSMMSGVRHEFEGAITELKKSEGEAVEVFDEAKEAHVDTDTDLNHDKDTLTVQEQTAEQKLDQEERDEVTNKGEIKAAKDYLAQLMRSCGPLITNYDNRLKLRKEEKQAIGDAIGVLEGV